MDRILQQSMLAVSETAWLNIKHPTGQLGGKNDHTVDSLAAMFFSLEVILASQD
jgi:hypothetical protein